MKFLRLLLLVPATFNYFAAASSGLNGTNPNLVWALKAQFHETGYQIRYLNFDSEEPTIILIDKLDLDAPDPRAMAEVLAQRYQDCVGIAFDDQAKTVTVTPKNLVHIRSHHVENSTYTVDGQEPFTLETENESKDRYFCVHDPSQITEEWQIRAFKKP